MSNNKNIFTPDYAVHPGEYLEELLEAYDMTQRELAERTGVTSKNINCIIKGNTGISASMAKSLERIFDRPSTVWTKLQSQYEQDKYRLEENKREAEFLSKFGKDGLVRIKEIIGNINPENIIDAILKFFNLGSIDAFDKKWDPEKVALFRNGKAKTVCSGNVAVWLRQGQLEIEKLNLPKYNKQSFEETLRVLRGFTNEKVEDFQIALIDLCAKCGVAVQFVPELKNTYVSGATYWINGQTTPCIQLSLRYKTNDHLWFSFFHEAGHVLLHKKKGEMVNYDNGTNMEKLKLREEKEADKFAGDFLISHFRYETFVLDKDYFSKEDVLNFSKSVEIHPGIVVGRLQHDGLIPFRNLNYLKVKLDWLS